MLSQTTALTCVLLLSFAGCAAKPRSAHFSSHTNWIQVGFKVSCWDGVLFEALHMEYAFIAL